MKIETHILKVKSKEYLEFIDITDNIKKIIDQTKIKKGFIIIYSKHTTLAIRINEKEKGLFADFKDLIKRIIPEKIYYRHNDLNIRTENLSCDMGASDCINGHSHCMHFFLGTSEMAIIEEGKLVLGRYQRIFAIELDCARSREIVIQITGI